MKHRRSINLLSEPAVAKPTRDTFCLADLREWYVLCGKCSKCDRAQAIDRWELARKFGAKTPFVRMMPFLRCTRCGNKGNNKRISQRQSTVISFYNFPIE